MNIIPENLKKYQKFISLVLKYRNSDILSAASDKALDELAEDQELSEESNRYTSPEELVEDLKNMGPTYVKIGQTLSTRPDLLPEPYLLALATLQDDVEEIPYSEIQKIVEEELGTKISKAFLSFETQPLASASIGQVHKAVLRSGKEVAVKIQRPGIRKNFIEDLDTLKELSDFAVKHSKTAKKYGIDDVLDEMRHILIHELDYSREAQNLIALGKNLEKFEHIVIPQPVLDYSTSKILTMDFVEGQKITSVHGIQKTETDFSVLIDELVEAYLQQIIYDGFAHADPHPGNVHLTKDRKIALMDLGMVAKFSPNLQEQILKLLIAISKYNGEEVSKVLLEISQDDKNADIIGFKKEINRIVLDSQNRNAAEMQTGKMLIRMNKIAAEKGIRIAVELNILGKILLNLDQIVAVLAPQYDLAENMKQILEKMMVKKMAHEAQPENFFAQLIETKKLAENLPERLNKITENLAQNQFQLKIDAIDEERFTDAFQKVANRISIALIIAALIIGSSLLMRVPNFQIFGISIAMFFFIIASVFGLWLAYKMVMKDEDFKRKK